MTSNFLFIRSQWPQLAREARKAEQLALVDPRMSIFSARRAVEFTVRWLYEADATLRRPYRDDLVALIADPGFRSAVGQRVYTKLDLVRRQGNAAVHGDDPIPVRTSVAIVRELFDVFLWLKSIYSDRPEDRPSGLEFDESLLRAPNGAVGGAATRPVERSRSEMEALDAQRKVEQAEADARLARALDLNDGLVARVEELQAQVAAAKEQNATAFPVPLPSDTEATTRDLYINVLLIEAGWDLEAPDVLEYPIDGLPGGASGRVDYVLWGEDGLPLAVVEAKRARTDPIAGEHQAKLYADALEARFGRRPVIFTSNGEVHRIWDDLASPPREVSGFYTREQLELLIERRTSAKPLASLEVDTTIAGRYYQQRAVRKVAEAFTAGERRALLVMATGSGKTRTVIALSDLLIRANWAKRILFLADRRALVKQAVSAFKANLSDVTTVNLLEDRDRPARVSVSTYPTMLGLINDSIARKGSGQFGAGAFDLIVVDEAHRSIYQKYKAIFSWFDARVVGLTATPRDEVDHDTYRMFELEDGIPTDAYELADAIAEKWLVPPVARSIESSFMTRGVHYSELSDAEKADWDAAEWSETGEVPDAVEAAAVNAWLFNADTVDKVLAVLMAEGRMVAGGDRLGKTIIFARSRRHASFVKDRFDKNYPEYKGAFAAVITHGISHVDSLIDDFGRTDSYPQIAISVDMLDTGIDVPDVVNLVFFKQVFSKTKFWQMVGRGTRLRPDLYGPGDDKTDFVIFDVGGNLEYFNADQIPKVGGAALSLGARLFVSRLALLGGIDTRHGDLSIGGGADAALSSVRAGLVGRLRSQVAGMTIENVLVRPHRVAVERYRDPGAWTHPSGSDLEDVAALAALPSAVDVEDTDEQAKRFDLLVLRSQLGVLTGDPGGPHADVRIRAVAASLLTQLGIPSVKEQAALLQAIASEDWWADVTVPMLEDARVHIRGLVSLLERAAKSIVYADFEDDVSGALAGELTVATSGLDRERFREKLFAFLEGHQDNAVLFKVRTGKQLSQLDLDELQRILITQADLSASELEFQAGRAQGLGLYIRSLVGLDRAAVSEALSSFTGAVPFSSSQIAFVDLITDQLTRGGSLEIGRLYAAPFSDLAPEGPDGLFSDAQLDDLEAILLRLRASAEVVDGRSETEAG